MSSSRPRLSQRNRRDARTDLIEDADGRPLVKPREHDEIINKERNKVKRCVNKLKQFRQVAT